EAARPHDVTAGRPAPGGGPKEGEPRLRWCQQQQRPRRLRGRQQRQKGDQKERVPPSGCIGRREPLQTIKRASCSRFCKLKQRHEIHPPPSARLRFPAETESASASLPYFKFSLPSPQAPPTAGVRPIGRRGSRDDERPIVTLGQSAIRSHPAHPRGVALEGKGGGERRLRLEGPAHRGRTNQAQAGPHVGG
ncbi:hypothetical protein chiPu_0025566, partial [Chiloscyllium punctatum]|nr:hypothetical protein [Chiloscyllium punctatum]